jgi:hypothetical protein
MRAIFFGNYPLLRPTGICMGAAACWRNRYGGPWLRDRIPGSKSRADDRPASSEQRAMHLHAKQSRGAHYRACSMSCLWPESWGVSELRYIQSEHGI